METRSCRWCGSSFVVARTTSQQLYCSNKCKSSAANAAVRERKRADRPTVCAECAGPVEQPTTGAPRRFCADECKRRFHNRKMRRRQLPLKQTTTKKCAHCGKEFEAKSRDRIYCYDGWCRQYAYQQRRGSGEGRKVVPHEVKCDGCGSTFTASYPTARWCSKTCANRHWGRVRARQRRSPSAADYTDLEVFQRDGWRCHICGDLVDWTKPRTDPDGATIDHIVPISKGGADEFANVATAHWRCNLDKRAS